MYEITLEIVVLNLISLSEWLLIVFDKVPGLNSWPMKDKFTFTSCQRNMTMQVNSSILAKTLKEH